MFNYDHGSSLKRLRNKHTAEADLMRTILAYILSL